MRIALVAHLRHRIAEPFMGGMEAHTFRLAEALIRRGHRVTLFAAGDSDPRFEIDAVIDEHYEARYPWRIYRQDQRLYSYLDTAMAQARDRIFSGAYDVVHNNGLHRFILQAACASGRPMVTSVHIPPFDPLHGEVLAANAPNHRYAVVSHDQVGRWWPDAVPDEVGVVHNGIDLDRWPFAGDAQDHALWCGRLTPDKGPHLAIAAARRAGIALRLFGLIEDQGYFDREIAPWLGDDIRYGGNLTGERLGAEMRQAGVLVFTPCWHEPFGLVLVEAMASGTPVAAFDRGAVREIVDDTCGVLVPPGDVAALADAMVAARRLPRAASRQRAETAFGIDRMVDGYERLYGLAIAAAAQIRNPASPATAAHPA